MAKANKVKKPNIVRGGIAIPLGRNYYYMSGRKHETGGIDIGKNPRTGLEVEDGEVMHMGKNEVKVFSSVPFLNGKSPAQKVIGGENPNAVFNAQESFKRRNKINDDGTKKKSTGGQIPRRRYITQLTPDEEKEFQTWYSKVAKYKNLNPNPDADGQDYDYRGYWRNEDRVGILGSNPNAHFTDKYKQPSHPTFSNESIYSSPQTPGGTWIKGKGTWLFKHNKFTARQADRTADYLNGTDEGFILGTDTIIPNRRKRMGGLSRSKDYGSKSKPYLSVKSGDFAGGHRSYPIPTKTDAIDALRLAGLHGRSDVRAKVYAKYPDLRKKSKSGGLYTLSVNGKQMLKSYPSTGDIELSKRQKLTGTTIIRNGGRRKARIGTDDYLVKENDTTAPDYSNNTNPFTLTENTNNPVLERNNKPISSTNVPRAFARRNRDITDPEKLSIAYQKESGTYPNWFKRTYRNVKDYVNKHPETVIDGIGLGSNIIGGLISHKMNRDMLNKLKYNSEPIARKAAKLKTRININPQLDKMRETLAAYERNVDSNTASSRVALARKQRARLANMLSTNELYGSKENIETELINKDKLNQQSVADANIRDYNDWSEKKAAFNNAVLEKKGENDVSLINTINTGVQDVINRTEKRKSEKQTRLAFMAANPNVNPRILKIMGIKGITDKDIEAYDKAYGKKKKGKKSSDNN